MLEITVHGLYIEAPLELAAAGALVSWGGEELARFQDCYPGGGVRSPLEAELRILTAALDWAREHGGRGETVKIRTGLGSLASTCRGRSDSSRPGIQELLEVLERVSADFEGIYAEISPGWITAPAQEAALRCLLAQFEPAAWLRPRGDAGAAPQGKAAGPACLRRATPERPTARAESPRGGLR
jgi:hypothetical protein